MFDIARRRTALIARGGLKVARLVSQCAALLTARGQAVSPTLARLALDQYAALDRQEQAAFFLTLLEDFSPDPHQVLEAAQRYAEEQSVEHLAQLHRLVESPRQELLRRLNRAPGGMAAILRMRGHLLQALRERPALAGVDWDFHHLLASWFNPGFLQIVRVDWRTPASLLERIIAHEAVHEIRGWEDLRRRLGSDRRCFAFFHPVLPEDPLIFVEVALGSEMPTAIAPLLDTQAEPGDPTQARVATLYSINNCQPGLRGVSLGNFLIKQVVELLATEFPRLRRFCTLSPIPGFAMWLGAALREPGAARPAALSRALEAVAREVGKDLSRLSADPAAAPARLESLRAPLLSLCATFLLAGGAESEAGPDPVARFHLNNGARLERINWGADLSKRGLRDSLGMMVNYVYDPKAIEGNHNRFAHGRVVASRQVTSVAIES
jgi:malonyl-CoA decarboxylase